MISKSMSKRLSVQKGWKSVCCNANIHGNEPLPDFVGDDPKKIKQTTCYFICDNCGNSCNIKEEKPAISQAYIDLCRDKRVQEHFLKTNRVNYCFKHSCFLDDGIRKCFGESNVSDCKYNIDYGYLPILDDLWAWAMELGMFNVYYEPAHKDRIWQVGTREQYSEGATIHEALLAYILEKIKQ